MNKVTLLFLGLLTLPCAYAGEWTEQQKTNHGNDITHAAESGWRNQFIWMDVIVPGMFLAENHKHGSDGRSYHMRYRLKGILGDSLVVEQLKGDLSSLEVIADLYIPQSDDGGFYFSPVTSQRLGVFRVSPSKDLPEAFTVDFLKRIDVE